MSRLPETSQDIRRKLRAQQRTADRVASASAYSRSGGAVTDVNEVTYEGLLKILGELQVTGDTEISGVLSLLSDMIVAGLIRSSNYVAGTSGWQLTSTGLEVNDITLRGGIIGNAALSSPVVPATGTAGSGTSSVSTTSTETDYATVTIAVPSGFTIAQVIGVSAARYNIAAQRIATNISGYVGSFQSGNDTSGNITSSSTALLTGLSGGNVTISSRMSTNGPDGIAYPLTSALVTFYR